MKSSKIFTAYRFLRDTNFKHEKSGVCKGKLSHRCQKTGLIDFHEKRAPTKVKHLLPSCQILRNFTGGNTRKFTVSFAVWAHVDIIKYRKTLMFSFACRFDLISRPQRACDRKTIGSHLKSMFKSSQATAYFQFL